MCDYDFYDSPVGRLTVALDECLEFVRENRDHGGADVVLEVAGAENTFELVWQCARPNAIVTVVALYDKAQILPLPDMYGKNSNLMNNKNCTFA